MKLLICSSILFLILSVYKPHRFEWLTLCVMSLLLVLNLNVYTPVDDALYWNRALIVTFSGLALLWKNSFLSLYHAIILLMTLLAFAALSFDVSQGRNILIYDNYEGVIYGIVALQLLSIFPTIRVIYRDHSSSDCARMVHIQRDPGL